MARIIGTLFFIVAILASGKTFAEGKQKPKGKKSPPVHPELFVPPTMEPLPHLIDTKCGYVANGGMVFYVLRSTSDDFLVGQARDIEQGKREHIIEECVLHGLDKQFYITLNEVSGGEVEHDQLTCSRQKAPGFPETFTVTSRRSEYLHPARVTACMKKLLEKIAVIEKAFEPQQSPPSSNPQAIKV